jgi:FkbM family methyltransferase
MELDTVESPEHLDSRNQLLDEVDGRAAFRALIRSIIMTKTSPTLLRRLINFPQKTSRQRFESFVYRWMRWFPNTPAPMRLPIGVWWLVEWDFIGRELLDTGFENREYDFAGRFVKPGMTVLDIGAHRGFYTLLFSRKVGDRGRVLSFEPSPRERKRLKWHLRINFCRNVEVKDCALGEADGKAELYLVHGGDTGCNSLRPPDTALPTSPVTVAVKKLDDILSDARVRSVDFIKLDVEGGELGVLRGAERLLQRKPRPVILCEVLEMRTRPWGYPGRMIVEFLSSRDFLWFDLSADGGIVPIEESRSEFHGNFVAVPRESLEIVASLRSRATANS